jgi:cellulase/cellobiase CelA1
MLKQRRFAVHWKSVHWKSVHWKSLNIPAVAGPAVAGAVAGTVAVVGLAIGLPASMASTYRTAGSVPAQSDKAKQPVSGGQPAAPGTRGQPAAPGTHSCLVQYTPKNYPGGFTAQVTISNKGRTSIHGWTLTFSFPGDQVISGAWNATFTQHGAEVFARGLNFDTTIRQGASQSLGFLGVWRSNSTAPASFRVNGRVCG